MLEKSLALAIVCLAVIGPGAYLLRIAWKRGGAPRRMAALVLVTGVVLIGWLFVPGEPGASVQERVSQFVGAWGMLFMGVGLVVIAAAAFGRFRVRGSRDGDG